MNGLFEILTNKFWMMSPESVRAYREIIERNIQLGTKLDLPSKKSSYAARNDGSRILDYAVMESGDAHSVYSLASLNDPFVNVVEIDGPITRNGGACSYGSIDHRNMVFAAANNKNCKGHIFVINTPGGSSWVINDYKQAVEYAKSKGQPVYAFIDGNCCSAGMYLAAICDRRFYMHPKNEVGCIGTLAAFYSEKSGDKNQFTNETYHEIYDPESFDKNKSYRDIVNDNNDELLVSELAANGREFRQDVAAQCPNVKDEHLHGKVFFAEDVLGILVDEQSTLSDVITKCFAASPASEKQPQKENKAMNEKYLPVAKACGIDELVVTDEGTFLAPELLDTLAESLGAYEGSIADAEMKMAEVLAAHNEKIKSLSESHESALAAAQDALKTAQHENEQAIQKIADLTATIERLTTAPTIESSASPANNGTGLALKSIGTMPAYDSRLTPAENARLRKEWLDAHKI